MTTKKPAPTPVSDEYAVINRRGLYMSRFVSLILIVVSVLSFIAALHILGVFERANGVHRARNEAEHICITEVIGEGRYLGKRNMDWSARDATQYYVACVDRVAPTLIVPETVDQPLRFKMADEPAAFDGPTASKTAAPTTSPPQYVPVKTSRGQTIYVYVPAPTQSPASTTPHPKSPSPKPSPTPAPTQCSPACVPSAP